MIYSDIMDKLVDRFLKYITFDTHSDRDSHSIPSTKGQLTFAKELMKELEQLNISVIKDKSGIVYAHIDSNCVDEDIPTIGFIAHMDTPPHLRACDIQPRIIKNYDGKNIIINKDLGLMMDSDKYLFLKDLIGHDVIVSDGTTILGADDKAGIAELMTMLDILVHDPSIKHGNIYVAFTVDEELGKGMEYFDLDLFPCDFAYTVDIDANDIHCLDYETICGGQVDVSVRGKPVHPGSGKGVLINASLLAMEFHNMLPKELDPYISNGYDGFNHLFDMTGQVDYANLKYRIGNFNDDDLWKQMQYFEKIAQQLNQKYNYQAFTVSMKQTAYNMKKYIEKDKRCLDYAIKAMKSLGLEVQHKPIRGGTDGSLLSQRGIPAPNLNNGSYNALSYFELVSIDYMKTCVKLFLKIISIK